MDKKPRKGKFAIVIYMVLILSVVIFMNFYKNNVTNKVIDYSKFKDMIEANEIKEVVIASDRINITTKNNSEYQDKSVYTIKIADDKLVEELRKTDVEFKAKDDRSALIMNVVLSWVLPFALIFLVYKFVLS